MPAEADLGTRRRSILSAETPADTAWSPPPHRRLKQDPRSHRSRAPPSDVRTGARRAAALSGAQRPRSARRDSPQSVLLAHLLLGLEPRTRAEERAPACTTITNIRASSHRQVGSVSEDEPQPSGKLQARQRRRQAPADRDAPLDERASHRSQVRATPLMSLSEALPLLAPLMIMNLGHALWSRGFERERWRRGSKVVEAGERSAA